MGVSVMQYPDLLPNWLILGTGAVSVALAVALVFSF
jgi:hypothetical protein